MKRRQLVSLLGVSLPPLAALPACAGAADSGCDVPVSREDGWGVAARDDDKLVDHALCEMGDRSAASSDANIHAVLVARGGALVYERYFKGSDQIPGIYRKPTKATGNLSD